MEEVPDQERAEQQAEYASGSVVQALVSDNPEVRASAFNATLGLLFRINSLTQKRQTQDQLDWETRMIHTSVAEALESDDPWIRNRAGGVLKGLLGTLEEVARKKQRVEKMIEQLRDEIKTTRRVQRGKRVRAIILLLGAIAFFYAQGVHVFTFWWLFFPLSSFWAVDRSQSRKMIQRLSEAWDPRAVGVLAVVAQERDVELSHQAQQALINLLPRVRASDGGFVDAEGMKALINLLREDYDELRLALLKALEQIGDERAISLVMDLRDSPRINLDVRQAAAECLPALENRVRSARESATLLRASSAVNPADAPVVLLRPAGGAPTATDNLLRSTNNPLSAPVTPPETTDPPHFLTKLPTDTASDSSFGHFGSSAPN